MPEIHRPDIRSDAELLAAHVAGDREAFGVLFGRHRDRLWAVALRTMGNPEDAADGLQDGMVAAYRRAGSFRGEAAVTTWLHRVVVNACLDRIRAAKVRRAEPLPDDLEEYGDRGSTISATDATEDPADVTVRSERRRQVLDALSTLPEEQRAALVLVDMEGYPVAEAAQMLEVRGGHREVALLARPGQARRTAGGPDGQRRRDGASRGAEPPGARHPSHPRSPPERHPSRADRPRPDRTPTAGKYRCPTSAT